MNGFKKGFTLIELLVVIAILGVLAGGVLVAINPLKRIGQANDARIKSDIGQIANAMQTYFVLHQYYPATVGELVTSGDLKAAPKQPDGTSDYTISCTTPDGNGHCTEASISIPLSSPQTANGSWQWDSTTGQAGEYVAPTPTPTTAPTATPVPDNNNPFMGDITYYSTNDSNSLQAWVCDRDYPAGPLTVRIYDGPKANNILVASGQTSFFWGGTNAASACATNAVKTGFSITTPASIKDGQTHTLYYYITDVNVNGQPGSRADGTGSEPFKFPR